MSAVVAPGSSSPQGGWVGGAGASEPQHALASVWGGSRTLALSCGGQWHGSAPWGAASLSWRGPQPCQTSTGPRPARPAELGPPLPEPRRPTWVSHRQGDPHLELHLPKAGRDSRCPLEREPTPIPRGPGQRAALTAQVPHGCLLWWGQHEGGRCCLRESRPASPPRLLHLGCPGCPGLQVRMGVVMHGQGGAMGMAPDPVVCPQALAPTEPMGPLLLERQLVRRVATLAGALAE